MKKTIFVLIFLILINTAIATEKYYALDLSYFEGALSFRNINLLSGTMPEAENKGDFTVKIISFYNELIDEFKIDIKEIEYPEFGIKLKKDFTLYIPYHKETKEILILKDGKEIFNYDLTPFADTCGDKICEPQESYENCPQDCPSGFEDDFCDETKDGRCDPDCSSGLDPDCAEELLVRKKEPTEKPKEPRREPTYKGTAIKEEERKIPILYYIIPALIIIIMIIASINFLSRHKMKKENEQELVDFIRNKMNIGYNSEQIKKVLLDNGYKEEGINKLFEKIFE